MARGLEVLRAAVEEGRSVRLVGEDDFDWINWDPSEMRWVYPNGHEAVINWRVFWSNDWEIESPPTAALTFAQAVSAMDRGETIERFEGSRAGAMVMRWRRDGKTFGYVRQSLTGEWIRDTFHPGDLYTEDWRIVQDEDLGDVDARGSEERPTIEDAAVFINALWMREHGTGTPSLEKFREALTYCAMRWPVMFRQEES